MTTDKKGLGVLLASGLAAILASTCCLGPLVLISLGLSGAWIGNLRVLEPYSPYLLALALITMILAYRRIFRPVAECKPGEICALPHVNITYKILFWLVAALIAIGFIFPKIAHLFY